MDLTLPFNTIETIGLAAVKQAGEIFHQSHSAHIVKHKSHREDIVTDTDLAMEKVILKTIQDKFPHHGFDSEEAGKINPQADFIWVIDPLDGTKNLHRGISLISTSLSCRYQGKTLFAAVGIHTWALTIHGTQGRGVYRNGAPAHVSDTDKLQNAFIYAELPTPWAKKPTPEDRLNHNLELFNKLSRSCYRIRAFGSGPIGLSLTAIGAFDAYINLYQASDPGDIEPGKFLVEQAGGQTSDITGQPYTGQKTTNLLASNGRLHSQLLQILNS
jgi:myo-inositol-1(or 4)-monophosphatase